MAVLKKWHLLITASIVVLLSCGGPSGSISLNGVWKLFPEGPLSLLENNFEGSTYSEIILPGDWTDILKKNEHLAATVWIVKEVQIDESYRAKSLALQMGRTGISNEVYFNGKRIGSTGIIPPEGRPLHYHFTWQNPRSYFIPQEFIHFEGTNTIAIRVFSHVISGVRGDIEIKDVRENHFCNFFKTYIPLTVNIASLVLNFTLLLVFLVLFVSMQSRKEYLYFSLVILFTLLCNVFTLELPFGINGLARFKVFLVFYALTNYFVFTGMKTFLNIKNKWLDYFFLLFIAGTEFVILMSDTTRSLITLGGSALIIFVNSAILAAAFLIVLSIRRDPRRYWIFGILVVIPVSVLRNSLILYNFRFNELPLVIFLHVPAVFTFITMYYIYDFEKSRKEKESLHAALTKKNRNIQRILNSLKRENSKPEPRDAVYDIIEYLDDNYNERYDRKELAKKFGLNEGYIGQVFKSVTGTNISSYINKKRIDATIELLTTTDVKIIDIAYHVGFDNLTHFHRQFKKIAGCTPKEYRELHGGGDNEDVP